MSFTVATMRYAQTGRDSMMHCSKGHKFLASKAVDDGYGDWCPECTRGAHSGSIDDCTFCKTHNLKK